MNTFIRWGKFNLVGAMGMVVQLTALALFNRWMAGHYLWASAAAIELTLLHNFTWHLHYTWRDRRDGASWPRQLVRFHLSNGLVSMLGNLVLMRLLVHEAHLPVLVSNVIAILGCSVANFCLGNNWAFARQRKTKTPHESEVPHSMSIHSLTLALLFSVMTGVVAHAQTPVTLPTPESTDNPTLSAPIPDAPVSHRVPTTAYHTAPRGNDLYHAAAFCGIGASTSPAATKPAMGCGAGLTFLLPFVFTEVGVMGPQANRSNLTGYISIDSSLPLARPSAKYLPMAIIGYSRLFETGHAFDYGVALNVPRFSKSGDDDKSLRIELRDYWTFANPTQHNVMLRIGWVVGLPD